VGQYTRIINVENITIKKVDTPTRSRTISATCTATTFVFVDAEAEGGAVSESPAKAAPKTAVSERRKARLPS